jgi:plastocyanin
MNRLTAGLGMVALPVVLAACSMAAAAPPSGTPAPAPGAGPPDGATISIVAKDMRFSEPLVSVPAGIPFAVEFDNLDDVPHNVAISDGAGASMFKGEIVTAAKVVYSLPALAAGTYTFVCEVHPDMQGTITAR